MSELTTTNGLISNLSDIQTRKLKYQALIAELEQELNESDLVKRINKWKEMLKELNLEEIEAKNKWIQILQQANIDKFEANWVQVKLKESLWRLVIEDEDKIVDDYKTEEVKTTIKIDKNAIKKDMKEWVIIEWVRLDKDITLDIKYL